MPNFKVVLAPASEMGISLIEKLLSDKANVIGVRELDEAINLASEDVDLIVCDMRFADSQMFEFLRAIKANAETSSIPFLCFNTLNTDLGKPILEAVTIACKSLGAVGFIDFWALAERYGIESAENIFQSILIELLAVG